LLGGQFLLKAAMANEDSETAKSHQFPSMEKRPNLHPPPPEMLSRFYVIFARFQKLNHYKTIGIGNEVITTD